MGMACVNRSRLVDSVLQLTTQEQGAVRISHLVPVDVAGRHEHVMHATCVFQHCQDWPALVGEQAVTNKGYESFDA